MKKISEKAIIASTAIIHDNVEIGDYVVIKDYAVIYPNVDKKFCRNNGRSNNRQVT